MQVNGEAQADAALLYLAVVCVSILESRLLMVANTSRGWSALLGMRRQTSMPLPKRRVLSQNWGSHPS